MGGRPSELPSAAHHRVVLSVMDHFGITEEIRIERTTAQLAGKRITLAYVPATAADVATIESFGGLYDTPPYLVNVRPVVNIDGVMAAAGPPLTTGTSQTVVVAFQEPDGTSDRVEHMATAGAYALLGLDLQRIDREAVDATRSRIETTRARMGVDDLAWDAVMGDTLLLHAQTYFLEVEGLSRVLSNRLNVVALKRPAEMLATFAPSFGYLFGTAFDVTNTGMTVDVRRYVVSVASRTGQRESELQHVLATGQLASGAEHAVFEQIQRARSVSAVKLIAESNARGIPVFAVDASNLSTILPQLHVSAAVIADVRNAVAAGKKVLIPRDEITYLSWTGVG